MGVLQLIREFGTASRSDLARRTGLAASSVSARVEELLSSGLIEEAGDGESTGGRRPRLLRIRPGSGVVLAIDLGTRHARLAVDDVSGARLAMQEIPVRFADGPEGVLSEVSCRLAEMAADGPRVLGTGISLPGPVDSVTGRMSYPSRMPRWHGFDASGWLEDRLAVPVAAENDANLLAFGESRAISQRHLVAVKIGSGIGCGIVADGVIYQGANGAAGDISHVRIGSVPQEKERLCGCGRTGCLETLASGAALLDALAEQGEVLGSAVELVDRVRHGDPMANMAVRTAGSYLGEVLAVVVNFFNPQLIVLGGALAGADPLIASLRAAIYERCLPMASQAVTITTASAGPDAILNGASALILDKLALQAGVVR